MNFIPGKYLQLPILKLCFNIVLVLFLCTKAPAQIISVVKDSYDIKNKLSNSITPAKTQHSFQRIDYTPPNNQLMSWPDYPLTTSQIEQRNEKWKQDHKLSNIIAKDIVESILSKKKKVAVVPKF